MHPDDTRAKVAVLGLGNMGLALTKAFLGAGHDVTVWNRTRSKCDAAAELGATVAPDAAAAVAASPTVVACLLQSHQVEEVLEPAVDRALLAGRTIANLTWATPDEVQSLAEWCERHGAAYLQGAVQCDPSDIGTPTAFIGYGGEPRTWESQQPLLNALGPADYVGEDPTVTAVRGNATGMVFYHVALAAFYEAAAYAHHYGVEPKTLLEPMRKLLDLLQTDFERGVVELESGTEESAAPTRLAWQASVDLHDEFATIGQRGRLTAATLETLDQAMKAGKAESPLSSLFEVLRLGQ